jgi:hypothetical protein
VIAAVFIVSAVPKLLGQQTMIDIFAAIGLGQWLRVATGLVEGLGSVLILIPAVSGLGAILVLLVDAGAFIAQVGVLHGDIVHTIVIALLIGPLAYLQGNGPHAPQT